jgi:formylglycine-generating enzyme required for sulfatase activity
MTDRKLCIVVCLIAAVVVIAASLVGAYWPQVRDFSVQTYERARYGKSLWVSPTTGMRFVLIHSGTFTMGDDKDDAPRHTQRIDSAFYMAEAEVTVEQFLKFLNDGNQQYMRASGHKEFYKKTGHSFALADPKWADCPITWVNWYCATAFCTWLSKKENTWIRLPTEAEWEYACRAGTTTTYSFGDTLTHDQANFDGKGGKDMWDGLAPVKRFPANAWGLYDMHGNAEEWCSSLYMPYPYKKDDGREDPRKPGLRVLRDGSWSFPMASFRSAYRSRLTPDDCYSSYYGYGFRCVRDLRNEAPLDAETKQGK